ncbi:helix-turn-helix domain-containing protein [Acinetobacter proteolyticus]|uniref:Helix-turn-helix domain-containing protein n=1 Tax=Acinetobacter proteolyticus TaxID=1776741 RepID=A0A2N0WES5_9GAMM|nr:helix-turn-helix domain-containing protein [Acinetobacter proteolyticus]PKF33384.1 helix-turn-helix domain-containing protein [Acinetobacter proteolyticus]
MSLDATIWAFKAAVKTSSQRLVLLALADRAGDEHKCYPSLKRLEKDTVLNRKTIIKVLDELEEAAFIKFTGKTTGNGVKIYQLIGVVGREDEEPTSTKNGTSPKNGTGTNLGTGSKNGTSTNNATSSSTKNGTATSTNIGTQNLPMNLSLESKNKKHWLCSKKLSEEIAQANPEISPNEIISASWFNREFRAFEKFNAEKFLCDELMIYHFANWLLEAKAKLDRMNRCAQPSKKHESKSENSLTEKQIKFLAGKLSRIPDFGKYAVGNESHEQLAVRLETMLKDPKNIQKWTEYFTAVGFEQKGNAA